VICETYDSLVAAAVRPERDDCGDDLGGDARKFGCEYDGEARAVGALIAFVAARFGDRVEVRRQIQFTSAPASKSAEMQASRSGVKCGTVS
jgi:hypothetical protein